jgi:hypothetical protein
MESGVFDARRDFSAFLRQTAEVDSYPDCFAAGKRRNDSVSTNRTVVSQGREQFSAGAEDDIHTDVVDVA